MTKLTNWFVNFPAAEKSHFIKECSYEEFRFAWGEKFPCKHNLLYLDDTLSGEGVPDSDPPPEAVRHNQVTLHIGKAWRDSNDSIDNSNTNLDIRIYIYIYIHM